MTGRFLPPQLIYGGKQISVRVKTNVELSENSLPMY
jgi:hypothetical protein